VLDVAAALIERGQQVLQQNSPDQPSVCFAAIPLLIPATLIFVASAIRRVRRLAPRPA
jgi:hypothetical protein